MEDRAGCAPGRLPAPSQEIWLWNTGQAVTPAPPPGPTQARRCDCGARAGCGSPRQSGRWDCGARGKLPARQTRLPRPQDCRTQVGLSPPTNCILIQEMGLWNTGQAVAPGPTCWAPPTPGDGVVEHRPGCAPSPRQAVPGDRIAELEHRV
jgi:hypothetical protein